MRTKLIILSGIIVLGLLACDNYEQFEEELYQNDVYIISQDRNFKSIVCDLEVEDSIHYVSFSYTGTRKIDKDFEVEIEDDTLLFAAYNYTNFELDSAKYIHKLDKWRYNFPSMSFTYKADSPDVYGLLSFYINPKNIQDLCPDSMYVIPIAIKSVTNYSVKQEKFNALLRIYIKNKYAETSETTNYSMKGYRGEDENSGSSISTNKVVWPLTTNSIRFYVGLENPPATEPQPEDVNRVCARVTVNPDMTLHIEPYKAYSELLEIETLPVPPDADTDDFPWVNIYEETPPRFQNGKIGQRFLMHYKYHIKNNEGNWGEWVFMREILSRI